MTSRIFQASYVYVERQAVVNPDDGQSVGEFCITLDFVVEYHTGYDSWQSLWSSKLISQN